ncbi:DMT family transporter [Sodalis sp. RH21]|uniref:DMT family transporter n=1 Tax=unclassified Sodalis (in: enterobacteria) TaxID=2636512 RepID=UPI0039B46A07
MKIKVYITLSLAAFFWGGSAIAGKYALGVFIPSVVTWLRFAMAALILFIFIDDKKELRHIYFITHLRMAITALFGVTLCYYFYFNGLNRSTAFNAGIIEATIPLITLVIAAMLGMERIKFWQLLGLVIAYCGVAITISGGNIAMIKDADYNIGDILLLISTLCFGIYNVLIKKWVIPLSGTARMFFLFFYGSLAFLPWLGMDIYHQVPLRYPGRAITAISLGSLAFMALGGSVLAYLFFNQGIDRIGASKAASFINLVPFITVSLSVFVLREPAGLSQWAGALVIIAGVMLSNRGKAPAPAIAPQ